MKFAEPWLALFLAVCPGVAGCSDVPKCEAEPWPDADGLFHVDSRWIGGDGAFSVDLGDGRVLWLFGDSFIASSEKRVRSEAKMVRNSVAIQSGYDPSRAFMQFFWREQEGEPLSFHPEDGARWFWPAHGVRLEDVLLLFFERVQSPAGDPHGFEGAGWSASLVSSPDLEPNDWQLEPALLPATDGDIQLGEAVVRVGELLYVYASRGSEHQTLLARYPVSAAHAGDLSRPEWWTGSGWSADGAPVAVLGLGSPELSVHYDARLEKYVMVDTQGYGPTTLAVRFADAPEGPWSSPTDILRPPESFDRDAFDYAGKAHPELTGADLVMTYVPSTFDDPPVELESRYYYPRFARGSCE